MSSKARDMCGINGLVLGGSSLRAIRDINDIQQFGNYLATFVAMSPLYLIFNGSKGAVDVGHNIAQHDWIQFADAMSGIPDIVRRDITNISENQAIMTTGDEKVFWRCMYNAVR